MATKKLTTRTEVEDFVRGCTFMEQVEEVYQAMESIH